MVALCLCLKCFHILIIIDIVEFVVFIAYHVSWVMWPICLSFVVYPCKSVCKSYFVIWNNEFLTCCFFVVCWNVRWPNSDNRLHRDLLYNIHTVDHSIQSTFEKKATLYYRQGVSHCLSGVMVGLVVYGIAGSSRIRSAFSHRQVVHTRAFITGHKWAVYFGTSRRSVMLDGWEGNPAVWYRSWVLSKRLDESSCFWHAGFLRPSF